MVHGSWLKAHGLCLKAHRSWANKKIGARARGLGDPAPIFLWAMNLEAWALSLGSWAMNHHWYSNNEWNIRLYIIGIKYEALPLNIPTPTSAHDHLLTDNLTKGKAQKLHNNILSQKAPVCQAKHFPKNINLSVLATCSTPMFKPPCWKSTLQQASNNYSSML